ncbi:MAG: hypothetical protein ACP5HM_07270 [Anaerolineae bacterium]
MRQMVLSVILALILSLGGLGIQGSVAAPPYQEPTWMITVPAEGSVVSGEVEIQGTATHTNFASYGVLYAPGPRPTAESEWVPIVFGVQNMVVNGPLATWDTTPLPNGQYTLALAVYEVGNDTPYLYFVNNITVQNKEATPTPSPTPSPTVDPNAAPTATPGGAIIAPTIEQPPTATPRPTAMLAAEESPVEEGNSSAEEAGFGAELFSGKKLKSAFWSGVWIAILLYAFGGLYVAGRAVLRYYLRRQHRSRNLQ